MEYKPQTFFIGVVDFFSVWLPGAILTCFLKIMFYNSSPDLVNFVHIPNNEAIRIIFYLLIFLNIDSIPSDSSTHIDWFYNKKLRKVFKHAYGLPASLPDKTNLQTTDN